jgi:hypothetical protein
MRRFEQLLILATDPNEDTAECAEADLFKEYDNGKDPSVGIHTRPEHRKQRPEAPDFTGEAYLGSSLYDVAAWLGVIGKGSNKGRPYIGLQLSSQGSGSSHKTNISLWEKQDRTAPSDPHFKCREMLNGQQLKFSAWVQPAGAVHSLRVLIEPFAAGADDLSEAALETQKRLAAFVQEAQLRLPDPQQPELPSPPAEKRKHKAEPELDTEPNDSPF